MAQLKDLGFRFAIDHVTRLNFDFAELAERGFRYIKIPAVDMLNEDNRDDSDIHIADLSDLAARHGISLIVEQIEQEAQVVDLLDMDVRFGQGRLFSDPKPVRAEVFAASPAPSNISQTA